MLCRVEIRISCHHFLINLCRLKLTLISFVNFSNSNQSFYCTHKKSLIQLQIIFICKNFQAEQTTYFHWETSHLQIWLYIIPAGNECFKTDYRTLVFTVKYISLQLHSISARKECFKTDQNTCFHCEIYFILVAQHLCKKRMFQNRPEHLFSL